MITIVGIAAGIVLFITLLIVITIIRLTIMASNLYDGRAGNGYPRKNKK